MNAQQNKIFWIVRWKKYLISVIRNVGTVIELQNDIL